MRMRTTLWVLLILLVASGPGFGKGPKDTPTDKKYAGKGGYSGSTASSKSKYDRSSVSVSRIPSQTPVVKRYQPSPPTSSSRTSTGNSPGLEKYDRYSKLRPSAPSSYQTLQSSGTGSRQPSNAVRFPKPPATTTPSIGSGSKSKVPSIPAQRPPIVFYPKSSKGGSSPSGRSTSASSATQPSPSVSMNRQPSSTAFKSKYFQPTLRPENQTTNDSRDHGPIIVNRPTTINQTTTNITHETNNINNWYNNNSWQNRVTINSHNWNDRPWWYQPDYGDWHHGHWHGDYIRGGPHRDDWRYVDTSEHQWLTGLAAWGLGTLIYRTGYQFYVNPYCLRPLVYGTTTIDYSRPITVYRSAYERAFASDESKAAQLRAQALRAFAAARQAFYLQNLDAAYDNINRAIALMPDDASTHEFRSLVLFAAGRYREAAEVIHAVLAVAPGWDWTTMSGLYQDDNTYIRQLRNLETYVEANPGKADARFLLAYHYITLGHPENAVDQLRAVRTIYPADRLAADLLDLLSDVPAHQSDTVTRGRVPTKQQLQGEWRAHRPEGKIDLDIDGDEFAWDYDLDDNDAEFKGKYVLAQDVLVLAAADGSQMVGRVTMNTNDDLTFRLIGAADDDPGILFERD